MTIEPEHMGRMELIREVYRLRGELRAYEEEREIPPELEPAVREAWESGVLGRQQYKDE